MKQVPLSWLEGCARFIRENFPSDQADSDFVKFGLSAQFLRKVVGNEWTNQAVFGEHKTVDRDKRKARKFLRAEANESSDHYRNQERTQRIAELLFNLQSIQGIDGLLERLRKGEVEAVYCELEAGEYLHSRDIPFIYVVETSKKGADFDGQISLDSGGTINCEMKCKVETTELSGNTTLNTLKNARQQLPADEPGVIFLKVPENWVFDSKINTILPATIADFLRQTTRVLAVIETWEEVFVRSGGPGAMILYKFRVEKGPALDSATPEVKSLMDILCGDPTNSGVSFQEIADRACSDPSNHEKRESGP